ncbi:hypothetical protein CYMTET_31766, partial [Cymbomonas tetramitiformis]
MSSSDVLERLRRAEFSPTSPPMPIPSSSAGPLPAGNGNDGMEEGVNSQNGAASELSPDVEAYELQMAPSLEEDKLAEPPEDCGRQRSQSLASAPPPPLTPAPRTAQSLLPRVPGARAPRRACSRVCPAPEHRAEPAPACARCPSTRRGGRAARSGETWRPRGSLCRQEAPARLALERKGGRMARSGETRRPRGS